MSDAEQDAAAVRVPPPLVYLAGIVAGWALDRWVLDLALGLTDPVLRWGAASLLFFLALVFMLSAVARFRSTGQDPKPWRPTPVLIQEGIYRFSRNPMYLALALFQVAAGLAVDNLWIVLLTLPVLVLVDRLAVRPEESYLEQRFGDTYRDYRAAVRKWL
ncbi:MAG: isoprenylcysteine carboxylmethyltransferase family protein [Thermoanaerobaculia bacterium]|nr:isoprenylcysteine carboxylmethyltransferase family protein [Thermoanaerobaculia bacterium]